MKNKYLPSSRQTRPWVRRWMLWVVGFLLLFLPGLIWDLAKAPFYLVRYHWADLADEVKSWKIGGEK